jgi:hypothetical protein
MLLDIADYPRLQTADVTLRTVQNDEEFFIVGSRSVHLALLRS